MFHVLAIQLQYYLQPCVHSVCAFVSVCVCVCVCINLLHIRFEMQAMIYRLGTRHPVCASVQIMRLMTPVTVAIAPGIWEPQRGMRLFEMNLHDNKCKLCE